MTEPAVAWRPRRSRTQLVVTILLFGLIFLVSSLLVDARVSRRLFPAAVLVSGVIGGVIPALGARRPRLTRWLLLISITCAALVMGLLARTIINGFKHLG